MRNEGGVFTLSRDELQCMLQWAGKDGARKALYGLHFDPARGAVEASDGHAACVANSMARSQDRDFIVPRDALELAGKLATKARQAIRVALDGDTASVDIVDEPTGKRMATVYGDVPPDSFPPLGQCVPAREAVGGSGFTVDPRFYARLGAMAKAGAGTVRCLGQTPGDDLGPTLWEAAGDGTTYTIVIMPKRA